MPLDRKVLAHEAHVWLTYPEAISDTNIREEYRQLLSAPEIERLGEIGSVRVRHEYLVTRALVRTTLSRYVSVRPEVWEFETSAGGRPEIAVPGASGLRFNLSHTRGVVACLVTDAIDAGVDVENLERSLDVQGLAERRFAAEEAVELGAGPAAGKQRHFFGLWTLKEAYLKACGHGITRPLRSVVFSLAGGERLGARLDPPLEDRAEDWQFGLFELSSSVLMAVALARGAGPDRRIVAWRCDPLAEQESRIPLTAVALTPSRPVAVS
ncbi:MAG: 4'-phosphopantetheinyl transferase superfamily protein [Thermoanaerobaculia bacterium]